MENEPRELPKSLVALIIAAFAAAIYFIWRDDKKQRAEQLLTEQEANASYRVSGRKLTPEELAYERRRRWAQVYYVRHSESTYIDDQGKLVDGEILSSHGKELARQTGVELAQLLVGKDVAIFSSPAQRCELTADILASELGCQRRTLQELGGDFDSRELKAKLRLIWCTDSLGPESVAICVTHEAIVQWMGGKITPVGYCGVREARFEIEPAPEEAEPATAE